MIDKLLDRSAALRMSALVVLASILFAACGDSGEARPASSATTSPRTDFSKPSWVVDVYPPDGAVAATERAVQLEYGLLDHQREVRLIVDGVDITSQCEGIDRGPAGGRFPSPGELRYDPTANPLALVPLKPGRHLATAKLVRLPEPGATLATLDEYDWSFTIQ
jgi:hypothetical protein